MIPTSIPIRSTKRLSGQTLRTSDDIWAAAKVGRVELRQDQRLQYPPSHTSAKGRGGENPSPSLVATAARGDIFSYRVIRSISAKSSGDSVHPAAHTLCSTCSGV